MQHGFMIYGLENARTNLLPYLEAASINEINLYLKDHGIFEKFIERRYITRSIQNYDAAAMELAAQQGHRIYAHLAACEYGYSDLRLTLPNRVFAEYIMKMPSDVICIAVVGAAHIPAATKNGTVIDLGLQVRLEHLKQEYGKYSMRDLELLDASATIKEAESERPAP